MKTIEIVTIVFAALAWAPAIPVANASVDSDPIRSATITCESASAKLVIHHSQRVVRVNYSDFTDNAWKTELIGRPENGHDLTYSVWFEATHVRASDDINQSVVDRETVSGRLSVNLGNPKRSRFHGTFKESSSCAQASDDYGCGAEDLASLKDQKEKRDFDEDFRCKFSGVLY